jgi:hypothetical protein
MSAFQYTLNVTGTCANPYGAVEILPSGGTAPYTFSWYDPDLGTGSYKTDLSPGAYLIRGNDATAPVNNEVYINVIVSSGMCLDVVSTSATTCGFDNGQIYVTASTDNTQITYSLYSGGTLIETAETNNGEVVFDNLPSGIYQVVGQNAGGCSASTETCIVYSSQTLDFGFYIVNDTQCASPTGKVYITGQTGTAPLTYLWYDGSTGTTITGLTQGTYEVTVTSGDNCVLSKVATVDYVPGLGLGSFSGQSPSCFASDGQMLITITGGTGPYLYSASTGAADITYAQNYLYTGLSAGDFSVAITDSALCKYLFSTTLLTPNTFYGVSIVGNNSFCGSNNGSITIELQGGNFPYTYTIIKPDSTTVSVTTNFNYYTFTNLSSGEYTVFVDDDSSCGYSQVVNIIAENKFTVTESFTGTTCGQPNGFINLTLSQGGTPPYTYLLSNGDSFSTSLTSVTFNSLVSANYTYSVTDSTGCVQSGDTFVTAIDPLFFSLYPTSCGSGSGGTITALINSGTPPFTFDWSNNISGNPQEIYVSGLTGGTYTLTITDDEGCTQTRTTNISCNATESTYQIYTMCETDFIYTSGTRRGILQMLNEGYNDLTSGNTDCLLNTAVYVVEVDVTGTTYSQSFYTGTTLLDIPTDTLWYDTVDTLISSIPGVSSVTIDTTNSNIIIQTEGELANQQITIDLIIQYDIDCVS